MDLSRALAPLRGEAEGGEVAGETFLLLLGNKRHIWAEQIALLCILYLSVEKSEIHDDDDGDPGSWVVTILRTLTRGVASSLLWNPYEVRRT